MVRPTLSSSHSSHDVDVLDVTTADDYVVQQMPVFRLRVHPGYFQLIWELKQRRRPFELIFPIPCLPMTPCQTSEFLPIQALKSQRRAILSVAGMRRTAVSSDV